MLSSCSYLFHLRHIQVCEALLNFPNSNHSERKRQKNLKFTVTFFDFLNFDHNKRYIHISQRLWYSGHYTNISIAANCPIPEMNNGSLAATIGRCNSGQCQYNTTLIYLCRNSSLFAYNLLGSAVITCMEQSTWYPPLGTCMQGE